MNRVEFIVVTDDEPRLEIKVDGVALERHARRAELRSAKTDRQEHLAGSYSGLTSLDAVCWPSRHFLGAPVLSATDDGDTVLLGCGCGDWGCWPLLADVQVSATTVTWRNFRNGHRPAWDLSSLRPFEFDRDQYESALRTTQQALRRQPGASGLRVVPVRRKGPPDQNVNLRGLRLPAGFTRGLCHLRLGHARRGRFGWVRR